MRAAVPLLPFDPDRVRALLKEAGLIDDQPRGGVAKVLDDVSAQVIAQRIRISDGAFEEMLEAVGRRIARRLDQQPAILALDRAQEP